MWCKEVPLGIHTKIISMIAEVSIAPSKTLYFILYEVVLRKITNDKNASALWNIAAAMLWKMKKKAGWLTFQQNSENSKKPVFTFGLHKIPFSATYFLKSKSCHLTLNLLLDWTFSLFFPVMSNFSFAVLSSHIHLNCHNHWGLLIFIIMAPSTSFNSSLGYLRLLFSGNWWLF